MARAAITRTLMRDLPALPEGTAKIRIFDTQLSGFIAERRRTGTTFYLRYTDHRGRSREVKLGRLGDVTVDQALQQAEHLRASVSLGADPVAERAKRRAVPLFADFARDRYLPHVKEHLRSAHNIDAYLRLRIVPFLGQKALDEITQDDVAALRRRLIDTGLSNASVNRHLATLRSMFSHALRWQLFDGRNPAASPGMLREVHRDRYLTAAETQAEVSPPHADRRNDGPVNALDAFADWWRFATTHSIVRLALIAADIVETKRNIWAAIILGFQGGDVIGQKNRRLQMSQRPRGGNRIASSCQQPKLPR